MGAMIAAGVMAAGAGLSAFGASRSAKAMRSAQKKIRKAEEAFAKKWQSNLDTFISEKEDKLYNLGDIFERFESTGAFGDTQTLQNLRQAQEDFSALAAGDFTAFSSQLRKSMSDALIGTVGSGAPIGTFAGLAADTQLNYRLQGIQTGTSLSNFFSQEANNLLGLEFGVMDQGFDFSYNLDRTRQTNVNNSRLGQASTEGVGLQAFGGALQQAGGFFNQAYQFNQNMDTQRIAADRAQSNLDRMYELQANPNRSTVNTLSINPVSSYIPTPPASYNYDTFPTVPTTASNALFPDTRTSSSTGGFWSNIAQGYVNSNPFIQLGRLGLEIASQQ